MSDDSNKDEQKTERFNMFMSPSEMKAIEDWAWENRIRSKSEAVRRLCQIGITADRGFDEAEFLIQQAVEHFLAFTREIGEGNLNEENVRARRAAYVTLVETWIGILKVTRVAAELRGSSSVEEALTQAEAMRERALQDKTDFLNEQLKTRPKRPK